MRVHLIAIGGAAMHNLALALHQRGCRVTGSDDEIFEPSRSRLKHAGLLPAAIGWDPTRIDPGLDAIIVGMHARVDNPELLRARELGLRIYSFPEFLFEQTRLKQRVVVGGSHGKTTVTALILHILRHAGWPFDYLVGSQVHGFETMVGLDDGARIAVFEGDEYLSSPVDRRPKFHVYRPTIALINGIAWDHANVFPTPYQYEEQFRVFASLVEPGGTVIYNQTDPAVLQVLDRVQPEVEVFGFGMPGYRVRNGVFYLHFDGEWLPLQLLGQHNMLNVAAAVAVCRQLGVPNLSIASALPRFQGASRRLECIHRNEETAVFLDFAHAPSKVRATVTALREAFPERPLLAILELHTFSSLRADFIGHYRGTLAGAEAAVVFADPHTFEQKGLPHLNPDQIRQAFGREDLLVTGSPDELEAALACLLPGARLILFMSSGSFGGFDPRKIAGDQ